LELGRSVLTSVGDNKRGRKAWRQSSSRKNTGLTSALSLGLFLGSPSVIKRTLEMQSEDTSATRDPLKEACLASGVWVNS
jgi:hypothetical protein